jgi:hypothetical protein
MAPAATETVTAEQPSKVLKLVSDGSANYKELSPFTYEASVEEGQQGFPAAKVKGVLSPAPVGTEDR